MRSPLVVLLPSLLLAALTAPADAILRNQIPVCTDPAGALKPVIAPSAPGGAIVVWFDGRGDQGIYAQRVLLASDSVDPSWTLNGVALCSAPGEQYAQVCVGDGSGGAIAAWYDARGADLDVYANHVLSSGVVDPAWPVNGLAVCTATDLQYDPAICGDGAGGAIVAWYDYRNGLDGDVYAQHLLASGSPDPLWPANGRAICTAADEQGSPVIVSDGLGGAIIAWPDYRAGDEYDVYAQRVSGTGSVLWATNGKVVCKAAGDQIDPAMTSDGTGGALLTWADYRDVSGFSDIYAQRISSTGAAQWANNGVPICTAPDEQGLPVCVKTSDGWLVGWVDYRSGTDTDLYAQRVLGTGAIEPGWPADGLAFCGAPNYQYDLTGASDSNDGAYFAWTDMRNGLGYIFAQHVLAAGTTDPLWHADGDAVSTAPESHFPSVVSDGSGGVLIAWDNLADVIALHEPGPGPVAAPAGLPASRMALSAPLPNPARLGVGFRWSLTLEAAASLTVLDAEGRLVRRLVDRVQAAGSHDATWDLRDDTGRRVTPGLYFIVLREPGQTASRKVAVLQ